MDTTPLINDGVLSVNQPNSHPREKTVVVLGVARGGTTMVASVLQALGVPMGDKLGPVMEDITLSAAIESRDIDKLRRLVKIRDKCHSVWGWKRPSAIEYADVWKKHFRNIYIIAVFRDAFAISNRNRISMLSEIFDNMNDTVIKTDSLVKFLKKQNYPLLLCSYEKALFSPDNFVKSVDRFLDLNIPAQWEDAAKQITSAPEAYLKNSRITASVGHLDFSNDIACGGWACYSRLTSKFVNVQLFLNGVLAGTTVANLPRPDVKDKGIHPTGLCGFRFKWPPEKTPQPGDRVAAKVENDIHFLAGSPKVITTESPITR